MNEKLKTVKFFYFPNDDLVVDVTKVSAIKKSEEYEDKHIVSVMVGDNMLSTHVHKNFIGDVWETLCLSIGRGYVYQKAFPELYNPNED